jgi:tetratricopeptide (TPR) repeat protein
MTWPPVRTLVIAGVAVVIVALAAFGGWAWWEAQQRRTMAATAEVLARVQPALAPDATAEVKLAAAKELEQILERYPSARSVPDAAYELGNVRFSSGQYAPARTAYELALQRGASGLVATMSRAGVARTWEAERNFNQAATAYDALVKSLDSRSFLYEDALLDQARVLELAGKKAEAIAIYQKLLKEVPTAKRSDDVRSRLASLGTAAR